MERRNTTASSRGSANKNDTNDKLVSLDVLKVEEDPEICKNFSNGKDSPSLIDGIILQSR